MSRIERALEKANKRRHSIKKSIAGEMNAAEYMVSPAKKMNIMSNKFVLIGLILSTIVASLLLFSMINYFVLKTSQHVYTQGSDLPKEALSLNGMEDTRNIIKEESSQLRKPSKAIFTIQAGAFSNALYAKALVKRLEKRGYTVYIKPIEENDKRLFKVCIGNFSNRQEAESLSKKIKETEDIQTFITLY